MLSRVYPNCLVLAALLALSALRAAEVPPAAEALAQLSTTQTTFTEYKDPYAHSSWTVVEIDFSGKAPGTQKWINNVAVSLSIAWGTKGPPPQLDLSMAATVNLVGVESGKHNTVFFFIPPEILARGPHGVTYEAGKTPSFYVVQYSVGGSALTPTKADYSSQNLPDASYVKGFLNAAAGKAEKGGLLTEATVAPYVLNSALAHLAGEPNVFPTYLQAVDAGH